MLIEGDGRRSRTATTQAHICIGNGFTEQEGTKHLRPGDPRSVHGRRGAQPALREAMVGQKVGARVAVPRHAARTPTARPATPHIGIGNGTRSSVRRRHPRQPTVARRTPGHEKKPPAWAPTLVEKDGDHRPRLHDGRQAHGKLRSPRWSRATVPRSRRARRHGRLPRPGLRRQEAVRRVLQLRTPTLPDRRRRLIKGWDKRLVGVKAGSRVILSPAGRGLRQGRQGHAEHQGRRHALLRHRRPRRRLTTDRRPDRPRRSVTGDARANG